MQAQKVCPPCKTAHINLDAASGNFLGENGYPEHIDQLQMAAVVVVVLAILCAWLWLFYRDGGMTHRQLADLITAEGAATRAKVDARCDALDAKLDRIESKIDKLIQLATPRLLDGMKAVE